MRFWSNVVLFLFLFLVAGWGRVHAQHTSRDAAEGFSSLARAPIRGAGPFLSVIHDTSGEPILVVNYPWAIHDRGSLEIATLPSDPAEMSEVRPLFFFEQFFQGSNKIAAFKCQDASAEVPTKTRFKESKIDFEVFGQRNSLGKPSFLVACRTPILEITMLVDRAFFCSLEPWSVDRRTLHLNLPREYFAKPGKLRVWFLRGNTVVWLETVDWRGFPE